MSGAASLPIAETRAKGMITQRAALTVALLAVVALVIAAGAFGPVAPAALSIQTAAGASGLGWRMALGCIACIVGFVIGAGTTIAGLAVFLAAHPELAILCASTCVAAAAM